MRCRKEIFVLIGLLVPSVASAGPDRPRFPEVVVTIRIEPERPTHSRALASLTSLLPPNAIEPPRRPSGLASPSTAVGRFDSYENSILAASVGATLASPSSSPPLSLPPLPPPPAYDFGYSENESPSWASGW